MRTARRHRANCFHMRKCMKCGLLCSCSKMMYSLSHWCSDVNSVYSNRAWQHTWRSDDDHRIAVTAKMLVACYAPCSVQGVISGCCLGSQPCCWLLHDVLIVCKRALAKQRLGKRTGMVKAVPVEESQISRRSMAESIADSRQISSR